MKRLYDLDPAEVSLVGKGANRKKFLVFKSEKGNQMSQSQEILNLVNSITPEGMKKLEKVIKGMATMSTKTVGKDMQAAGQPVKEGLDPRAQAALKAVARIFAPFKDQITDDHLDAIQQEIGLSTPEKTGEDGNHQAGEVQMSMEAPEGVKPEDHEAAMGGAKKAYMEHMAKMGYQKYPAQQPTEGGQTVDKGEDDDEEDEDEDINKSKNTEGGDVSKTAVNKSAPDLSAFPKEQRAQLEMVFKANADLAEKNKELIEKSDKLEKAIADRDAKDQQKEIVAKAAEFKHIGLSQDEIIETLADAKKSGDKSYERVCKQFATMDEQARTSEVFKEYGSRQSSNASSAQAQLDRLVDSVVQKSDGNKTRAQIYDEVCMTPEGKKLVAETLRESMGVR